MPPIALIKSRRFIAPSPARGLPNTSQIISYRGTVERGTAVNAGDVKVLSTHAVFEVMREVGPAFERERGCILSISYDPASVIKRQIKDGAGFDVAIVTKQVIHDLVKQGDILNDTCADIGRSGLGVAIRKGAPKPEIGTVDGFKRAILGAASVVRSK